MMDFVKKIKNAPDGIFAKFLGATILILIAIGILFSILLDSDYRIIVVVILAVIAYFLGLPAIRYLWPKKSNNTKNINDSINDEEDNKI